MDSKHLLIASLIATASMLGPLSANAQVTEYTFKSVVTETTPAPEAVIYHEAQIAEPLTVVETRPVVIEQPAAVVVETRPRAVVVEEVVTQPTIVVEKKKHRHNTLMRLGTLPLRIVF